MGSEALEVLTGRRLPPRLSDLEEPPERLYLRGELPRGPAVAVVGTRDASEKGLEFAHALASDLAAAGVAVLSGGAEGIDTAAHEGALAAGGTTVVVAPAGWARPYPDSNQQLYRRVLERGGAYVSLVPDDVAANPASFFPRNACLAALCHAMVVVETRFRGGSCNAAKWARRAGRPVFAVPHSPWHKEGSGANALLRLGAEPLDRAEDVLKLLSSMNLHGLPPAPSAQASLPFAPPALSASAASADPVLEALLQGAGHADEIAELTGLSMAAVQQRILTLALSGVLVPGPWGSLKLVTS